MSDITTGELQACADAASERVQALETQLDTQSSEADTAAVAAQAELEFTQANAAATLITVRAELMAALGAAETELQVTKVGSNTDSSYTVFRSPGSRYKPWWLLQALADGTKLWTVPFMLTTLCERVNVLGLQDWVL